MDLATGAMGSLLLKLGDLITEEYKLQTSVKEDMEYMKRELASMYIALRKVGDVPREQLDHQVKSWADEVRNLSYMMEDIIDKFLVRVEGAKPAVKPRRLKRLMKKIADLFTKGKAMARHEISDEIKCIKIRVQEAADRRDRYKVNDVVANADGAIIADPRLLALYKDRKDLVGIDGPLKELTNMLSDGDGDGDHIHKQLKIVSIFGFGGLGKTTLARALYDKCGSPFDCSAFVPVGRNPSAKKLLNDILFEIGNKKYPDLDERQLIDTLRGLLENKRYFIVIDDIWDIEAWDIVRCALVNNCESRIITTTRNLDVATETGEVYRLEPLSRDLSEELFHTRLFNGNSNCTSDMPAKVYDKILRKCGGVPLAIITMASLLVNKPVESWFKVYNSIGFGHEDNKDVDNTRKILLFSYYDLPCHLRTCLLHLSIYPEDYLIKKDSLIWLWVGEGFIHEELGVGLFEVGERYFNKLVNKSMLIPVESSDEYIISGCRVHDMVLDMICVLAKEENFVTILDSNEQYTCSHTNARRLVIGERKEPLVSVPMLQIRSWNSMCLVDKLPSLSCFQVLRVLNLSSSLYYYVGGANTNVLQHLGKLVHLRYLRLDSRNILEVPDEIGYLKFIQVLELGSMIEELPRCIGLLSQLKCLNAHSVNITEATDWIGNLTSLQELCVQDVEDSSNFVRELGKLTELRKLRISGHLYLGSASKVNDFAKSLVKLQKIQVIDVFYVYTRGTGEVTFQGYIPPQQLRVFNLPNRQPGLYASIKSWSLPNLSHLSVHVDSPDVEIFGRFAGLVYLSLDMDRPSQGLHAMGGAGVGLFPKLRVYETNATPGRFLPGAMPSLESLEFSVDVWTSRDGNIHFDIGSLVNLPMLQKLKIWMMAGERIKEEDWRKAEETVKQAVAIHPNHPLVHLKDGRGYFTHLDDPDSYGV